MTDAGKLTLPDLSAPFKIANDTLEEIQSEPAALVYFQELPTLYVRVRIGNIEEMRENPAEFKKRFQNFIIKTAVVKQFRNWNDQGEHVQLDSCFNYRTNEKVIV